MTNIYEPFTEGLVTSRPAHQLQRGELTRCDNAVYRANAVGLYRPPGWTAFGTVGSGAVTGLVAAKFDNGSNYLIGQVGTKYRISGAGPTSSYSDLATITGGSTLVAVHWQDRYVLMNGVDRNLILRNDGTVRRHGVPAVTATPKVTLTSGTWANALGYYQYWTTEAFIYAENGSTTVVESAFEGLPELVNVVSTSSTVTIFRPAAADPAYTPQRWRVYRTAVMEEATPGLFPVGELIAELTWDTLTCIDGVATSTSFASPTSSSTFSNNGGTITAPLSDAYADDTNYVEFSFAAPGSAVLEYATFGITGVTEPITGIEVNVGLQITASTNAYVGVELVCDKSFLGFAGSGTDHLTGVKTIAGAVAGSIQSYTVGGDGIQWQQYYSTDPPNFGPVTFTKAMVEHSSFGVRLHLINYGFSTFSGNLDYIKVKVHHSGTLDPVETTYPIVLLTVNGVETPVAENGRPPIASTGTMVGGSLVTNDVEYPSYVRWSIPGDIEAFPKYYFDDFETDNNDRVIYVGELGDKAIIGLTTQLYRMNYLPSEDDPVFSRGIAREVISTDAGVVSPEAACKFTGADGRTRIAFMSQKGLMQTDGHIAIPLTQDIDWSAIIYTAHLPKARLVNNPDEWELVLYYASSVTGVVKELHLNYHPGHLKGPYLKVSGPVDTPNYDTTTVGGVAVLRTATGSTVYYGYASGAATYADDTIPGGTPGVPSGLVVSTRNMHLAGLGGEWRVTDILLDQKGQASAMNLLATPYSTRVNKAEAAHTGVLLSTAVTGLTQTGFNLTAAGIRVQLTDNAGVGDTFGLYGLVLRAHDFGEAEVRS